MNFWTGCEPISPGCAGCYAETWAKRAGRVFSERKRTTPENWRKPYRWDAHARNAGERARVFTNSLADFFDNKVPDQWRAEAFEIMRGTPHLDWLVLTKRIGNARAMIERAADWLFDNGDRNVCGWLTDWYRSGIMPSNIWLGATVVTQAEVDRDVPKLLAVPARVHFLSCEPLLEWVYLGAHFRHEHHVIDSGPECAVCGIIDTPLHAPNAKGVDWVIVGGESGGGARGMDIGWATRIVEECRAASVPVFVKQLGARPYMSPGPITWHTTSTKGGDMSEWPEVLRVREFPRVSA